MTDVFARFFFLMKKNSFRQRKKSVAYFEIKTHQTNLHLYGKSFKFLNKH